MGGRLDGMAEGVMASSGSGVKPAGKPDLGLPEGLRDEVGEDC